MKSKIIILITGLLLTTFVKAQELHLYGGQSHNVYLGCLTCSDIDSDSIWNDIGDYGSNISNNSIWNDIGDYGSDISDYSPWNDIASYPPVIVDKNGNFYGYLTVSELKSDRANFGLALTLYKYHNLIKDDVSKWYSEIFE